MHYLAGQVTAIDWRHDELYALITGDNGRLGWIPADLVWTLCAPDSTPEAGDMSTSDGLGADPRVSRYKALPQALRDFKDDKDKVYLNGAQLAALAVYFDADNPYREDDGTFSIIVGVDRGLLVVNGTYLNEDGEFSTFHPEDTSGVIYID